MKVKKWGSLQCDLRGGGFHSGWRDIPPHLPGDSLSSPQLSEESGRSVQHGASSIPPAGCLGPVWGGLLTTGPIYACFPPPLLTDVYGTYQSSAAQTRVGITLAIPWDCHINIYRIWILMFMCMQMISHRLGSTFNFYIDVLALGV